MPKAPFSVLLVACVACSTPAPNDDVAGVAGSASNGGAAGGSAGGGAGAGDGATANASGGASAGAGAGSAGALTSGGVAGGAGAGMGGAPSSTAFPNGALAAVTLTYDDGLDPHLAIVQPALEGAGLRGTFFLSNFEGVDHDWALPNSSSALTARHRAWQAAGQNGHELASHTVNHPCNSASKAPGYKLTDYSLQRMMTELDDSAARLQRLGATPPLTFAFPCASDMAGLGPAGEDYSSLVAQRFQAARVSVAGVANPAQVDLLHVPQRDAGGKSGDELKAMVDEAIAAKGWLVLLFHGVGEEQACAGLTYAPETCMINYLTTSAAAHEALVQYLAQKKAQVWTATFKDVAAHLDSTRR